MMICSKCHNQIDANVKFCPYCGEKNTNGCEFPNPNKKNEKILTIANIILSFFAVSIFNILIFRILLPTALFVFMIVMALFLIPLGIPLSFNLPSSTTFLSNHLTLLLGALAITNIVIFIVNIVMGIKMSKINQQENYSQGKYATKKLRFVLTTYFLGLFGVARIGLGDKKRGALLLICTLTVWGSFISVGLCLTDIVIALSKKKDTNGYIYL